MAASTMPAISGKIGARYWEVPTSGTKKGTYATIRFVASLGFLAKVCCVERIMSNLDLVNWTMHEAMHLGPEHPVQNDINVFTSLEKA
jgi:hypothetical protein